MNLQDLIPPMPDRMRESYEREVMDRIRAGETRRPVWNWLRQPRSVFALGGVLAAVLAVLVIPSTPCWITRQIDRESQALLEAGNLAPMDEPNLEKETQEVDRIVLAEANGGTITSGAQESGVEALDEVDPLTTEEILEELKALDQSEMDRA